MSWFSLAILYVIGTGFANILRKVLMKDDRSDAVASAIFFQLIGAIIVSIVAIIHGFKLPLIATHIPNFILQASFWGLATMSLFKAYQYSEASEVTIVVSLESVIFIIVAVLFLGDKFTYLNMLGTILIILSVILISFSSKKFEFNKGFIFGLGYAIFSGIAIVNDAFMVRLSDALSYLAIGFLTPGLFIALINPKTVKKLNLFLNKSTLKKNFTFTFVFAFAGIAFYLALAQGGQVSQVNTIAQASVISTIILATIFLNEREHLIKKIACALLVTIGVLLLR